jgi:2'-5' RNA ligase
MHRLFVAIRPPQAIRDLLIDAMDDGPQLGWVGDDNLHVTLRFIGAVERPLANDIASALGRIGFPEFHLQIRGVGRFERRNGGALWAGIEPRKPVTDLAAKIDRVCVEVGLEPEPRAFHPHVTLARWGRSGGEAAAAFETRNAGLSSPDFAVDCFTLFESHLSRHGAHYRRIADYKLTSRS